MENKLTNRWYKAEIIFKAIASILIPLAIASLGFFAEKSIRSSQEREAIVRIITELSNKREEKQSTVRREMLNSVFAPFLDGDSYSYPEKVMALELLAYHFNESVHIKPIFIGLRTQLISGKKEEAILIEHLENVAKEITEKQMAFLEAVGEKIDRDIDLEELERIRYKGGKTLIEDTLKLNNSETYFRLTAKDFNKQNKEIKVRLGITMQGSSEKIVDFWVGFFDFPSINNIRLSNDQRCAVVLRDFNAEAEVSDARVTLIYFPVPYKSLIEKALYEEVIEGFRKSKIK